MKNSIENWAAETSQLGDDLKALEQFYQEQHHESVRRQVQPKSEHKEPLTQEDSEFLEELSSKIAHQLEQQIYSPETLSHYKQLNALQEDNHVMARHIEELTHRLEWLEQENEGLRHNQAQYRHLLGKVFIRVS